MHGILCLLFMHWKLDALFLTNRFIALDLKGSVLCKAADALKSILVIDGNMSLSENPGAQERRLIPG